MSLPHNGALQTSLGIRYRRWWLQNQFAIVLQQIRFNHLPASGLQTSPELKREERKGLLLAGHFFCPQAAIQPGLSTLRWKHPRSAHTAASRRGHLGAQSPASRETELEAAGSGSVDAVLGLPKIQTPMLILSLVKSPHEPVQCFEKIRHLSLIT